VVRTGRQRRATATVGTGPPQSKTLYATAMTPPDQLYQSWMVKGSYFNRMIDCGHSRNRWVEIALGYLPYEVLEKHKEGLVFIALSECDACRLAPQYREREVILLSDRIFPSAGVAEDHPTARYFIFAVLHEVAHAIRQHRSPRFDSLSKEENEAQELEADDLAYRWFNQHVKEVDNPFLLPLSPPEVHEAQERNQKLMQEQLRGV